MRRSLILSAAAAAAVSLAASSAMADLVYSFETLYDATNTLNPAGTRPDDFFQNGGGGTAISQSTIGVTDGSFSMLFHQGAPASFTGALTQVIPAIIDDPSTTAISFDLTVPATGNFVGNFARIGISEFGNNDSDPNNMIDGAQVQTVPSSEANIDLAPGSYHFTIPLIALGNPVTGDINVPFSNCFGTHTSSQLTPASFELYINKSTENPLNVYIDNVQTIGATTTGTWAHTSGGSWGTLPDWSGGIPQVALDIANFTNAISANATIDLDANRTVAALNFNSTHQYDIVPGAGGTLTLDAGGSNTSTITDSGGTHTIGVPVDFNTATTVTVTNPGDTLNMTGGISGIGGLTLTGAGTLEIGGSNTYIGGTTVSSGVLVLGSAQALPPSNSVVTIASTATVRLGTGIGGPAMQFPTIAAGGILDINNDHLFINYTTSDPSAAIYNLLKSGYNGGTWTGPGIDSSTAALPANEANYGVGFVDGADGVPGAVSAPGVPLTSGQILIAYALYGDVNLDGLVNATDFAIFGANFNSAVTGWEKGDFTYSGLINATDFALLGANFGKSASGAALNLPSSDFAALDAFAAANGLSLPSVPEPASLGVLAVSAIGVLARRRRRDA